MLSAFELSLYVVHSFGRICIFSVQAFKTSSLQAQRRLLQPAAKLNPRTSHISRIIFMLEILKT